MPFMEAQQPYQRPAPLTGPILTRKAAREMYGQIVAEMEACEDKETLEIYLITIGEELAQFQTQLERLWLGDGYDFLGLDREIKKAFARFATYY